jgi:hypothetical protein
METLMYSLLAIVQYTLNNLILCTFLSYPGHSKMETESIADI